VTDRVQALTVVLDKDIREDDVEAIVKTIEMVRGVATVSADHIANPEDWMARERVRRELSQTMLEVFWAIMDGRKVHVEPK